MIDIKKLLQNPDLFQQALKKKGYTKNLNDIIVLDEEKRQLQTEAETLKAEQNKIAKEIPTSPDEKKQVLLSKSKEIKEQLKELQPKLAELEERLKEECLSIPNPPLDSVPHGKDDSENEVIKTIGEKPEFDFEPLDHVTLGTNLDVLDLDSAASTSGARFYYLKNELVQLEFALAQFVLNKLAKKGFTPIMPPVLVKEHAMMATGFFPTERNNIYHVNPDEDDLYLVGTSEVPLCMLHADKIIEKESLPLHYMAFSTCFRREAGTYGKDTHGIIRVHQFDKMEMFSFCHPDKSQDEHELILSIEEEIMQDLGFHYQVVNICGGDLGDPAAKKYDIEVWIPTQNKFRELTSCSNCTDFQSRRAKIRFKDDDGTTLAHTLNGTALAMTRTMVAIMENYQQKDGSIKIPPVLHPYMNGITKIASKT